MNDLHKHLIRLSEGQKRKLRIAYKKRRNAVIGLKKEDIAHGVGKDYILLNNDQHKAIEKSRKNKTGLRLNISFDQLLKNKQGGLLKEVMELVEKVPGGKRFISPMVRRHLAPMLKEKFIPWLKHIIDNELDTIIDKDPQGAGLKRLINNHLDAIIYKKKFSR